MGVRRPRRRRARGPGRDGRGRDHRLPRGPRRRPEGRPALEVGGVVADEEDVVELPSRGALREGAGDERPRRADEVGGAVVAGAVAREAARAGWVLFSGG